MEGYVDSHTRLNLWVTNWRAEYRANRVVTDRETHMPNR